MRPKADSPIGRGTLEKNGRAPFELRYLEKSDLPLLLSLQEVIAKALPSPEIFRLDTEDYFRRHFDAERGVIGAFAGDRLIAYGILSFPGESEDNFGRDIGLPPDELKSVAHLETSAVHPDYRGNGLQKKIFEIHFRTLENGNYAHALCTVSPKNYPSLRNMFDAGMVIRAVKIKFGWMLRYILHKDFRLAGPVRAAEVERVPADDLETQKRLLAGGWYGFDAVSDGGNIEILFGK